MQVTSRGFRAQKELISVQMSFNCCLNQHTLENEAKSLDDLALIREPSLNMYFLLFQRMRVVETRH